MARSPRHHDGGNAPRIRRDLDAGARRAHSRSSQRPTGPTFDARHFTHDHTVDPETGETRWVRKVHDSDRALGPTLLAVLTDPHATPEDIERAALDASSEVITWRDPFTGETITSARGEMLNRWRRYLRRRARHLAHLERVAQRAAAERAAAERAPRAMSLEEAKARARAERSQRAAAERQRLKDAEARAVRRRVRVRVER